MAHAHERTLLAQLGFQDPDRRSELHDRACCYIGQRSVTEKVYAHVFGQPKIDGDERKCIYPNGSGRTTKQTADVLDAVSTEVEAHVSNGYSTVGFIDAITTYSRKRMFLVRERGPSARCEQMRVNAADVRPPADAHVSASRSKGAWIDGMLGTWTGGRLLRVAEEMAIVITGGGFGTLAQMEQHAVPLAALEWRPPDVLIEAPWNDTSTESWYKQKLAVEVKAGRVPIGDIIRQMNLYRAYMEADAWAVATCYRLQRDEVETLRENKLAHLQLSADRINAWAAARKGEDPQSFEV